MKQFLSDMVFIAKLMAISVLVALIPGSPRKKRKH